jgi:GT2 family glycosyltransferase
MEYRVWAKSHDSLSAKGREQLRKAIAGWQHKPLISIVMPVYNPPLDLLEAAIASIQAQIYPHWELCIADDASPDASVWRLLQKFVDADHRIKAVHRPSNGHISHASNSALELASGEFIALMDNDDLLAPDALYWVAEAVNRRPTVKIIYSDEDRIDAHGERYGAYFKPDWNYTLFLGHNMISHLGVYHTQLAREVGGFRPGLEGSQDYDLALRCIEKLEPSQIVHIPKVLYHWRAIAGSTALSIDAKSYALDAAQRALQEHLVRTGSDALVQQLPSLDYKCVRSHGALKDGLSVVLVCPRGRSPDLEAPAWTRNPAYAVREVLTCTDHGASINAAVASAQGALVALVAVHLCPREPAALLELAGHALEARTGAAAGTVRSVSGLLVSGGLVLNQMTIASVLHKDLPAGNHGYAGRGFLSQELSALSLDCVVLRKEVFTLHGGWDVDLGIGTLGAVAWCVRLREKGYRMVWCPDAAWTIPEEPLPISPTVGPAKRKIFMHRYGSLCAKWLQRDPAYHPQLDPVAADFSMVG